MASWMKDLQERVRRASSEVNTALQPRVAQAKRSLEESIEQMGLKRGRDIYDSDPELLAAITRLDSLRSMLKSVAETVEAHKKNIIACAQTQKKLGEALSVPDSSAVTLFENHVSSDRVAAQVAFGAAQLAASNAMSRFALDMSTPMADLSRTFEETYVAKISPLKKKYAAQKTEYFKYLRQAAAADDEAMRYNLEAVAQNARPVWERSSEELRGEIQSLVSHTLSSMSEWSLNVAQAEAEAYSRSVRAFEGPAKQAETAQNAPPAA